MDTLLKDLINTEDINRIVESTVKRSIDGVHAHFNHARVDVDPDATREAIYYALGDELLEALTMSQENLNELVRDKSACAWITARSGDIIRDLLTAVTLANARLK